MEDCLFCKIIAGQIPSHKIYEDDRTFAFLDIGPVSVGHTLVIPKIHSQDLAAAEEVDAVALMKTVHLLAPKIVAALGAAGYNLGMNHGIAAGQDVLHTHLHIMPRMAGSHRGFEKTHPSQEELKATADKIRVELGS